MTPTPALYLTLVVVLGIAAQWLAWRVRLPAILMLLLFGFAFGRIAPPGDYIPEALLTPIVSLSVAIILFEGGLSLRFRDLKETGRVVIALVTVGCAITWLLGTLACLLVFSQLRLAALAGAVFVVTGPTVIGPLLRHVRPTRRVGSIAKWEGIVIDPIGAMLAVLVFEAVVAAGPLVALEEVSMALIRTIAVSVVLGVLFAAMTIQLLHRRWLPDYLENPVILSSVLLAFAISHELQHESGLATVTVFGVLLANQKRVPIEHLVEFKENLGVLLISGLFMLLSSQLNVDDLTSLGWQGIGVVATLILLIRPIAVMTASLGSSLSWSERTFLAWLAPRGIVAAAVASVFSLELAHKFGEGETISPMAEDAALLVPLTFLVIVGTVATYGLTAGPLARWLNIAEPNPQGILFVGAENFVCEIAKAVRDAGFSTLVVDTNRQNIINARMTGLRSVHGNILSEMLREELELGGVGRLLAMTPNDEVNTLAAQELVSDFNRARVSQLQINQSTVRRATSEDRPRGGRRAFRPAVNYAELSRRFASGSVVKTTRLTEEFTFADFERRYPDAVLLFVVESPKQLAVCHGDMTLTFRPGQQLISLVQLPNDEAERQPDPSPEELAPGV